MEVRDPIHGFIHLTDYEKKIIDSKPFQRLRNIKQLGMTHYIYPSAVHTRFEHSLGTVFVANQLFEIIERKFGKYFNKLFGIKDELNLIKRLKMTLRIAALLHDVGHSPFSHATEEIFPKGLSHEKIGVEIIRNHLEDIFKIREIKRSGIDLEDITFLIYPEEVPSIDEEEAKAFHLLREMISGDIDADRIDYLIRDSYHTGVIYGRFDYMRLIDTITIIPFIGGGQTEEISKKIKVEIPEARIGIEYGGLHTVEGLLLARYFMFLQVYFHRVRRIYDLMLTDYLKYALPDGKYPSDTSEYLEYDDIKIIHMLRNSIDNGNCKEERILAERIINREHPKRVYETLKPILNFEEFEKTVRERIEKKFNELHPEIDIYVDYPEKTTFKPSEAEFYVINEDLLEDMMDNWTVENVKKFQKSEKLVHIANRSELLQELPKKVSIIRIYANLKRKKDINKANEICRKVYNEFENVDLIK